MWLRSRPWILLFLFNSILVAAEEIVTCTSLDTIENGSFEDGSTSWGFASGTSGSVVSGDAADGDYYVQTSATSTSVSVLLYQRLSNLLAGNTYGVSFEYRVVPNSNSQSMTCYFKMYMDSFTTAGLLAQTSISVTSSTTSWSTLSGSFTPTSSGTHTFEIYGYCTGSTTYAGAAIDLDNIIISGTTSSTCTTSTVTPSPTPTPTTSPSSSLSSTSAIVSSAALQSSSVAVGSSSSVISKSTPAIISSAALQSSSVAVGSSSSVISRSTPAIVSSTALQSSSVAIRSSSSVISKSTPANVPTSTSSPLKHLSTSIPNRPASSMSIPFVSKPPSSYSRTAKSRSATLSASVPPGSAAPSASIPLGHGSSSTTVASSETYSKSLSVSSATAGTTDFSTTGLATTVPVPGSTSDEDQYTTSTVFSTRTATITACPSSVTDCPAREKITRTTTETILVSTTVCPVSAAETTHTVETGSAGIGSGTDSESYTTSTIFSTRTATITACPSSVTDCPAREKTTYLTTETILVSTTVCPVTAAEATATVTANEKGTDVTDKKSVVSSTIYTTSGAEETIAPSPSDSSKSSSSSEFLDYTNASSSPSSASNVSISPGLEFTTIPVAVPSSEASEVDATKNSSLGTSHIQVSRPTVTIVPVGSHDSTMIKLASSSTSKTIPSSSSAHGGQVISSTTTPGTPLFTGGSVSQYGVVSMKLISSFLLLAGLAFVM
ncbi:hypothetical protein N7462_001258 [Penicillium macrosclerotiorum]|uniref:uncharacterized protein n=1 Tax=Penicillium macrosclerotiorum TaxID=303699 RepID=UPI00254700CE|nr:uncharacterized protein N7462_001258 [Penicillium macrosclerotiorum]KAJ5691835.1 hypothetical protein N7462_001258 [Penicillium macrosclerotiorum]